MATESDLVLVAWSLVAYKDLTVRQTVVMHRMLMIFVLCGLDALVVVLSVLYERTRAKE